MATAYLSIPLALSGDLDDSFKGTNKNTGLLEWRSRNPEIQVELADRIDLSLEIVTRAIQLGCFSGVLKVYGTRLRLGDRKVNKSAGKRLSKVPGRALTRAQRLGYWFASAGSMKIAFDALGVSP